MSTIHPILSKNSMVIVDVGAKETIEYINEFESETTIYAFEPNSIEYDLLKNKYSKNKFKYLEISSLALADKNEKRNFFITENNSMSSLLEPDLINYKKHFGKYKEFKKWEENITQNKIVQLEVETLDNYFFDKSINLDYLKIDTQGSELLILKGAMKLLQHNRIKVIKVEVSLVSVYKNQVLFAEIDDFLRKHNFILVDFITYRNHTLSLKNSNNLNNHYAPCGDAIYYLEEEKNTNNENIKIAILLSWLNYKSLALNICTDLKISEMAKSEIVGIKSYANKSLMFRIIYNFLPPIVFNLLKKIKQIL